MLSPGALVFRTKPNITAGQRKSSITGKPGAKTLTKIDCACSSGLIPSRLSFGASLNPLGGSGAWRSLPACMSDQLSSVLNEAVIERLASPRSFGRGEGYFEEGRVGPLRADAGRVSATVQGAADYVVQLRAEEGGLRFSCSCPVGAEGEFCKHCVAVALSWLKDQGLSTPTLDDARAYLQTLPPGSLVELLIEHAHEDEQLARRLLMMTTRPQQGASVDVVSLRALIDQAFAYHGFVHYREVWGYVRGIEETIDSLDELLAQGRAGEVVELAEYALAAFEQALEEIDDSDGQMADVAARLEELHLDACRLAELDPVALAERLFEREMEGDWDVFDRAVLRYADVLGDSGLERYRELARARWAKVPELAPGENSRERFGGRFRITRIMETLAELSGSLTDQIAVRERDLASAYSFLQIAELCRSHGDHDAALEWAERGMAEFPDAPDSRVRTFLIEEYRRRDRIADAIEHSWTAFVSRPTLDAYRELATDAKALGEWTERRTAAIPLLKTPEPAEDTKTPCWSRHAGNSELARVFLWEDDPEAAWQAAGEGGCVDTLWLQLADLRRAEHPEDALTVYRRQVEATIAGKDKRSYAEAVRIIDQTIRPLFTECDRPADFDAYVAEVRATHRPKRNLMKAMDGLQAAHTT